MSKAIVIVGFGPGTATAVAERFGREGFSVALVGRSEERLARGVSALKARGINTFAFPADAADPAAIRAVIRLVRSQIGPITVIFWNAYGGIDVGDLLTADSASLHRVFDAPVFGLLAAVDEALPDLKAAKAEPSSYRTAHSPKRHPRWMRPRLVSAPWASRFRVRQNTSWSGSWRNG